MRVYRGARQLTGAVPARSAPVKARRQRKPNAAKAARLAEIEASAVPGRTIITTRKP